MTHGGGGVNDREFKRASHIGATMENAPTFRSGRSMSMLCRRATNEPYLTDRDGWRAMSLQAMSWVLEHSTSCGTTRCVLMAIANHVSADGSGWAYVKQVREEANCSEDSYLRAIRWLTDNGELRREVNRGEAKKAAPNRRPNHFVMVGLSDEEAPAEDGPRNLHTPATCLPQDPQDAHPKSEMTRFRPPQDAHPEPLEQQQQEPYKEPRARAVARVDRFEEFYEAYPRHVGKGAARRAWATASRTTDPALLVRAAAAFADTTVSTEAKFIPHPSTWLNGERWLDEPDRPATPTLSKSQQAIVNFANRNGAIQ